MDNIGKNKSLILMNNVVLYFFIQQVCVSMNQLKQVVCRI